MYRGRRKSLWYRLKFLGLLPVELLAEGEHAVGTTWIFDLHSDPWDREVDSENLSFDPVSLESEAAVRTLLGD